MDTLTMTHHERKRAERDRQFAERQAARDAFQRTLYGRAVSSYTPQEYAIAETHGIVLQDYRTGCKGWDEALTLRLPGMSGEPACECCGCDLYSFVQTWPERYQRPARTLYECHNPLCAAWMQTLSLEQHRERCCELNAR